MQPDMHHVLGLPEIQHNVCQFLAPPDAAALAQTSHAFFYPAIEHLWGTTGVPIQCLLGLLDGVTVERNKSFQVCFSHNSISGLAIDSHAVLLD